MTYRLKFPQPFIDAYGAQLEAAWSDRLELTLDDGGIVVVEKATQGNQSIMRAATAKSAVLIRRWSDRRVQENPERYPAPSSQDIAAVLGRRNP